MCLRLKRVFLGTRSRDALHASEDCCSGYLRMVKRCSSGDSYVCRCFEFFDRLVSRDSKVRQPNLLSASPLLLSRRLARLNLSLSLFSVRRCACCCPAPQEGHGYWHNVAISAQHTTLAVHEHERGRCAERLHVRTEKVEGLPTECVSHLSLEEVRRQSLSETVDRQVRHFLEHK